MTTFIRKDNSGTTKVPPIRLTIAGSRGNYRGWYSENFVFLGTSKTTIEIEIRNETSDGALAAITDYSSSGVTARRSPITSFEPSRDGTSAVLTIVSFAHELIDFGVFVEVTRDGYPPTTIFCDPQASNDPIRND